MAIIRMKEISLTRNHYWSVKWAHITPNTWTNHFVRTFHFFLFSSLNIQSFFHTCMHDCVRTNAIYIELKEEKTIKKKNSLKCMGSILKQTCSIESDSTHLVHNGLMIILHLHSKINLHLQLIVFKQYHIKNIRRNVSSKWFWLSILSLTHKKNWFVMINHKVSFNII